VLVLLSVIQWIGFLSSTRLLAVSSEWVWRVYAAARRADRPAVYGWLACAKIAREAVFNGPLHKRPLKRPAENDRRHEPAVNGWPISPAGLPRKRGTSQR